MELLLVGVLAASAGLGNGDAERFSVSQQTFAKEREDPHCCRHLRIRSSIDVSGDVLKDEKQRVSLNFSSNVTIISEILWKT